MTRLEFEIDFLQNIRPIKVISDGDVTELNRACPWPILRNFKQRSLFGMLAIVAARLRQAVLLVFSRQLDIFFNAMELS